MDTDLFQILTLILLLGLLLTLFGVLQSLGAIRRTFEQRGTTTETPARAAAEPAPERTSAGDEPATWAHPTAAERETAAESEAREPARTGWPSPEEAAAPEPAASASEPAAASAPEAAGGGRVLYGDGGLATATPSESALQPAGASSTGTAGSTGAAETEPAATGASSAAEDPQEQPFERDGRWWFRRGDELLVYEEQSGQWVAAGEPSTSGSVASSAPAAAAPATATESAVAPSQGEVTTQHEAVGSFWKCPSCGAVNGSTATSCRMCFTARP